MCVNPRMMSTRVWRISEDMSHSESFTPGEIVGDLPYRQKLSQSFICPCGKCIECKQAKQHEWYPRISEELRFATSNAIPVLFVTLTYRDVCLPMTPGIEYQRYCERPPLPSDRNLFVQPKIEHCVVDPQPTLKYDDVRLWLKRGRIALQRSGFIPCAPKRDKFGKIVGYQPFYFQCISEYGPNTFRPHYHLLIFGLTRSQFIKYLGNDWTTNFGFIVVKEPKTQKNNALAKYLSKYLSKPSLSAFEKTKAYQIRERPQIRASKFFGMAYAYKLYSWHLATDVPFSERVKTICDRLTWSDPETTDKVTGLPVKYKLPLYYFNKIFAYEYYKEQTKFARLVRRGSSLCPASFSWHGKTIISEVTKVRYKTFRSDNQLILLSEVKDELRKRASVFLAEKHGRVDTDYVYRNYIQIRFEDLLSDAEERSVVKQEKAVAFYRKSRY